MHNQSSNQVSTGPCTPHHCMAALDCRLPTELLTRLLYALPPHSAAILSRTNKRMHQIVRQESLYWRECYRQQYGGEVCRQGFTWCDNEEIAESMDSEATLRSFLLNRSVSGKYGSSNLQSDWYAAYRARANLELRWQRNPSNANAGATVIPSVRLLNTLTPDYTDKPSATVSNPWRRSTINVHAAYTVVANENGVWISHHPLQEGRVPPPKMLCYPVVSTTTSDDIAQSLVLAAKHESQLDNQLSDTMPIPINGYNPRQCWSNGRWIVVAEKYSDSDVTLYHVWEGATGRRISNCHASSNVNDNTVVSLFNESSRSTTPANTPSSTLMISTPSPTISSSDVSHRHACHLLAGSQLLTCNIIKSKLQLETSLTTQRWRLTRSGTTKDLPENERYNFITEQGFWQSTIENESAPIVKLLVSKLRPNLLTGVQLMKLANGNDANLTSTQIRLLLWDMRGTTPTDQLPDGRHQTNELESAPIYSRVLLDNLQPHDTPTVCQDFTDDAVILHGNAVSTDASIGLYHWIVCCTFKQHRRGSVASDSYKLDRDNYGREQWRRVFPAWQSIWSAQPLHAVGHLAITFGEGDGSWQDPWLSNTTNADDVSHQDYGKRLEPSVDGFHIMSLDDGSLLRTLPMRPTRLIDAVGSMLIVAWDNVRHGVAAIDTTAGKIRWRQRFPEDDDTNQSTTEDSNENNINTQTTRGWLDVRVSSTRLLMMERRRQQQQQQRQQQQALNTNNYTAQSDQHERLLIVDFA